MMCRRKVSFLYWFFGASMRRSKATTGVVEWRHERAFCVRFCRRDADSTHPLVGCATGPTGRCEAVGKAVRATIHRWAGVHAE